MDLEHALARLRGRDHIVFTGPPRVGTTIAARILARYELWLDAQDRQGFAPRQTSFAGRA